MSQGAWGVLFSRWGLGRPLIALSPQVDVQLQVAVPRPGRYALVVEYANEEAHQEVGVVVHTPQHLPQQGALTLLPCLYRYSGRRWGDLGPRAAHLLTAPAPPPAPSAGAPLWTSSTTWWPSAWTQRPASGSRPSRRTSSW